MTNSIRSLLLASLALAAFACERSSTPTPAPTAATTPLVSAGGLIPGTPEGDLEQWVGDVLTGLDSVNSAVASDRAGAHRRVLDLYVGRQEYMEMYYGAGGRMAPTEGLAKAVTTAETRFHELMTLTGATPPTPEATVRGALTALRQTLEVVLTEAKASPTRLRQAADSTKELP
jgi:hypothetical protein